MYTNFNTLSLSFSLSFFLGSQFQALDVSSGVLRATHVRQQLCSAMFRRDTAALASVVLTHSQQVSISYTAVLKALSNTSMLPALNQSTSLGAGASAALKVPSATADISGMAASSGDPYLQSLSAEEQIREKRAEEVLRVGQGGVMLVLANRFLSETLGLVRRFADVEAMAATAEAIPLVEAFLLDCGVLGYTGKQMHDAMALRQQLVRGAMQRKDEKVLTNFEAIKQRALLMNLLISRDMENLREQVELMTSNVFLVEGGSTPAFAATAVSSSVCKNELVAAAQMLRDFDASALQLEAAIAARDEELLSEALAHAAYRYLYSDKVAEALQTLGEIGGTASALLRPIITALRDDAADGNADAALATIERAVKTAGFAGWLHPAIHVDVVTKIVQRTVQFTKDEGVKSSLISIALGIKNRMGISNPSAALQLVHRATAIGLQDEPGMRAYMGIIQHHLKRHQHQLKLEDGIHEMIASQDVNGLQLLLEGRGSGKMVMSAPSEYMMHEWLTQIQQCCSGGAHEDEEVVLAGFIEKAARGKGKVSDTVALLFPHRSLPCHY
jgi:hypothetical protein